MFDMDTFGLVECAATGLGTFFQEAHVPLLERQQRLRLASRLQFLDVTNMCLTFGLCHQHGRIRPATERILERTRLRGGRSQHGQFEYDDVRVFEFHKTPFPVGILAGQDEHLMNVKQTACQ
jgi:hypothetical protein